MVKIRNLFGGLRMTWLRVLLFAVGTAVVTAVMLLIPPLDGTSFQDIGVNPGWWILFALLIVTNCEKWWEAALKCFVFFFVSQPLIYLLQVPFSTQGWGLFGYYRHWFLITLLTLPGGAVAFLVKKKNMLSAAVLCAATVLLGCIGVYDLQSALMNFPFHLLSALLAFAGTILFIFMLLDARHRPAALAVTAVCVLLYAAVSFSGRHNSSTLFLDGDEFTYTLEDSSVVAVEINGNAATVTPKHRGRTAAHFEDHNGSSFDFIIEVAGGKLSIQSVGQ